LRDHGNNELFDKREDMAVRVAHNLVQLTLLGVIQRCDVVNTAQPVRQETLREIESLAPQDFVFFPRDLLGVVETILVRVVV
jgi:hypothetical protein